MQFFCEFFLKKSDQKIDSVTKCQVFQWLGNSGVGERCRRYVSPGAVGEWCRRALQRTGVGGGVGGSPNFGGGGGGGGRCP